MTYTLPTNRMTAQSTTAMPLPKVGARARACVTRRSSRLQAYVVLGRDLLDRQDVVHQVVDLLVVHGAGEPDAPGRHVRAGAPLGDRGDDVLQGLDERMTGL